jgi:hypothetical protein
MKTKKPAILKSFIYIVAYEEECAYDEEPNVAFKHWRIKAKNKEDAYKVGMEKCDPKIDNDLLNNYVIAIK